jgi:hypothetical protein
MDSGFILFVYTEKNKAKEMVRVGVILEKIRSKQAFRYVNDTDIGKKKKKNENNYKMKYGSDIIKSII